MLRNSPCPRCGADGVPILRGMPTDEAIDAADAGRVVIAGCVRYPGDDTTHQCSACGHSFRRDVPDSHDVRDDPHAPPVGLTRAVRADLAATTLSAEPTGRRVFVRSFDTLTSRFEPYEQPVLSLDRLRDSTDGDHVAVGDGVFYVGEAKEQDEPYVWPLAVVVWAGPVGHRSERWVVAWWGSHDDQVADGAPLRDLDPVAQQIIGDCAGGGPLSEQDAVALHARLEASPPRP